MCACRWLTAHQLWRLRMGGGHSLRFPTTWLWSLWESSQLPLGCLVRCSAVTAAAAAIAHSPACCRSRLLHVMSMIHAHLLPLLYTLKGIPDVLFMWLAGVAEHCFFMKEVSDTVGLRKKIQEVSKEVEKWEEERR